ncbi:Mitochondrial dicarboxylate transporter [Maublancomyces gigas]|uniref:Mitochondrial dicarboxylate transporter n=1 Tax=Discina gigas TaxID=1032678 RepID=A0ABR3GGB3_9PEZI
MKPLAYPFWLGGSSSCLAALFTHPLDLVKVRLQTAAKTPGVKPAMLGTLVNVVRHEATYSTTRFGVYEKMKTKFTYNNEKPSFLKLVGIASASGWVGGAAGNPADIINVRMQQDRANPPEQRRNYKNALDGLIRMAREEGPRSLFRGIWPNTLRAALMTAAQLASYDQFKAYLLKMRMFEDGLLTHFTASLLSGLVATTICSPVDVIKTRIMTSHDTHGIVHLLADITRKEGVSWMFRGWVPSFMRLGPHTILTFIALEQHKKVWRWMNEDHTSVILL